MALIECNAAANHGGPDAGQPIRLDFSTNAHPLGPNPYVLDRITGADRARYPDPGYTQLRRSLADFHGTAVERIVIGGSASEIIWRVTRCWSEVPHAAVSAHAGTFGEYLRAAGAYHLTAPAASSTEPESGPTLHWCCSPDNPTGAIMDARIESLRGALGVRDGIADLIVADLAYEPFRSLLGRADECKDPPAWREQVAQLWSPNKLHGLTGVRGAYLILPAEPHPRVTHASLSRLAASWVLGADGVALLEAHIQPQAEIFLQNSAATLRAWKLAQDRALAAAGWLAERSPMHYGLWKPPIEAHEFASWLARLREQGIKVRDAASFGRAHWVRLVCRDGHEVQELIDLTPGAEN